MITSFKFRQVLFAPAMLFLCGIFLQSCTEEMPILSPNDLNGTTSNASTIVLKVNNSTSYTLINKDPGYAIFVPVTTSTGTSSATQYSINGSNGSQTNTVDFGFSYVLDDINKNYLLTSGQLNINNKSYATVNLSGKAQLTVEKMNATAFTATGNYGFYLYDSPFSPTDSIYVSGTFNIVK